MLYQEDFEDEVLFPALRENREQYRRSPRSVYKKPQKLSYTPRLSADASETVRRLSKALGVPMTKTLEYVIAFFPLMVKEGRVCKACGQEDCAGCVFHKDYEISSHAAAALHKVLSD